MTMLSRHGAGLSRRIFVSGLAGLGASPVLSARADVVPRPDPAAIPRVATSRPRLDIDTRMWTIGNRTGRAFTVNGSAPAPTLRWR
ncbi:copper oxidase, partial [Asaia sp. W19]